MSARHHRALALAVATILCAGAVAAPPALAQSRSATAAASQTDKAARLQRLYEDYWNASMRLNPLQATFQGDARHNDQLPNFLSQASRTQISEFMREWKGKAEAIGSDGLQGQDLLSYEIFLRDAHASIAAQQFPAWMLPINQYHNISSIIAVLGSGMGAQPFNTVKDYENWSRRALGVPVLFNQAIANMRQGVSAGVVQPRSAMEKVLPQLDAVITATAEESLFWAPIRNMPEDIPAQDRERLTAEYKRMIEHRIMPAYRALRGYIATEYLAATRDTDGLAALPGGEGWYRHLLASSTAFNGTPEELHKLGIDEVARLEARFEAVMKQARLRGKPERLWRNMRNDRSFEFKDDAALLAHYQQVRQQVEGKLPTLVSTLPKAALEIRPFEPERAANASAASYQPPAMDGSQPGVLYVNTHQLAERKRWAVPMHYLHEAIPGHHLQLGLQQQVSGLPRFRRMGADTAFVEGWALYAESLGSELGLYEDPHAQLGYLQQQLLRTARMVTDTGLHAAGRSRRQAIDYLVKHAYVSNEEAAADVERSIAQPGQALAHRLGELKIIQLRDKAKAALGDRFDLPAFHAELLKDGSLPLDILDAKMERWVAAQTPAP